MAYTGTLLTIGGTPFPLRWMYKESYHVTPHVYDLDSTRTVTGGLQRNVLVHKSANVSFETKPMKFDEYEEMWAFIRSKYTGDKPKTLLCEYYNFETGQMEAICSEGSNSGYPLGYGYIPDVEHSSDLVIGTNGLALSATIEIIGY